MSTQVARVDMENISFLDRLGRWLNWPRFIFLMIMTFFLFSILFPFLLDGQLFLQDIRRNRWTCTRLYSGQSALGRLHRVV